MVLELVTLQTPARWHTGSANDIMHEIRIGLVERWEAGLIPEDALEEDYHLIAE